MGQQLQLCVAFPKASRCCGGKRAWHVHGTLSGLLISTCWSWLSGVQACASTHRKCPTVCAFFLASQWLLKELTGVSEMLSAAAYLALVFSSNFSQRPCKTGVTMQRARLSKCDLWKLRTFWKDSRIFKNKWVNWIIVQEQIAPCFLQNSFCNYLQFCQ